MNNYKLHPETAQMLYLSSLENSELLQNSIDVNEAFLKYRTKAAFPGIEDRIAEDKNRLKLVEDYITHLLEDNPELSQV